MTDELEGEPLDCVRNVVLLCDPKSMKVGDGVWPLYRQTTTATTLLLPDFLSLMYQSLTQTHDSHHTVSINDAP